MVREAVLFTAEDRYEIDRSVIDPIALPVGDSYGNDVFSNYLDSYAGACRRYGPSRILEIGVRYGYSAICMLMGARAGGVKTPEYLGIDDESYHGGSCARANQNFQTVVPWAKAQAIKWNSITQEMPLGIGTFDFCSIDGNHERLPVLNDLEKCWPLLNVGAIVLLDDATIGCEVHKGICDFLLRFNCTEEVIETQYWPNLRNHFFIRKAG